MKRHLIAALNVFSAQTLYFAGYKDDGDVGECIWAHSRWDAKWFDEDDAKIEAKLLEILCPNYVVEAQQVAGPSTQPSR